MNKRSRKPDKVWVDLAEILAHAMDFNETDVYVFLNEMNAPNDLKGITVVADRVLQIIDTGLLRDNEESQQTTELWRMIAIGIHDRRAEIEQAFPQAVTRPAAQKLRGYTRRHPVYAALWQSAKLEETIPGADARLLCLQALFLLWHILCRKKIYSKHDEYFSLSIRKLSEETPLARSVLLELPDEVDSDEMYCHIVLQLKEDLQSEAAATKVLEDIAKMVGSLLGTTHLIGRDREGGPGGDGGHGIAGGRYVLEQIGQEIELEGDDGEPRKLITRCPVRTGKSGKPRRDREEDTNPKRVVARIQGKYPFDSGHYSCASYAMSVRHAHAALDRAHNTSHAIFQGADSYAIHLFVRYLEKCHRDGEGDLLAHFALATSLFTARAAGVIAEIEIDDQAASLPKSPKFPRIYLKAGKIVLAGPDTIGFRSLKNPAVTHRPAVKYVVLALPKLLKDICTRIVELQKPDGRQKAIKPFNKDANALQTDMNTCVREINRKTGCSLTVGGIRQHLFKVLRNHPCGGHIKAAILCDHVAPTVKNPLHYQWVALDELLALHQSACAHISSEAA
jgi:hypothetical protein